jgi:hypothetical protein
MEEYKVSSKKLQPDRRNFLKQIAHIGAGGSFLAAVGMAFGYGRPSTDPQPAGSKKSGTGYRLTPHVRTYYEKADG